MNYIREHVHGVNELQNACMPMMYKLEIHCTIQKYVVKTVHVQVGN